MRTWRPSLALFPFLFLSACGANGGADDSDPSALRGPALGTLRVAVSSEATAIDPHYSFLDPNIGVGLPVFESLFQYGPEKDLRPLLADSAAPTRDPSVWRIALKRNVKFHSGAAFTKADVLCNFRRVLSYKLSAGGYAGQLRAIDVDATAAKNPPGSDPYELLVVTKAAAGAPSGQANGGYPFVASDLASIFLTSCASVEKAMAIESEDPSRDPKETSKKILAAFAEGGLADGTGPYAFDRFVTLAADPEHAMVRLRRSTRYYGEAPAFDALEVVPILDEEKRVAALTSGDVQLVAGVSAQRHAALEAAGMHIEKARGLRVMHMWMYQTPDGRESSATHVPLRDDAGQAYPSPFASLAFRKACALALDKRQFVTLMEGNAVATGQMLPPGRVGHLDGIPDDVFDRAAAREALAAAAREPGFEFLKNKKLTLTLHGPNDRYPHDADALALVAQQWTDAFFDFKVGDDSFSIRVVAKSEPKASYFANAKTYLAGFLGGGIANGHASSALQLYMTPGSALNYGNYASPAVSAGYAAGTSTSDTAASDAALVDALKTALEDRAVLPIYNPLVAWAMAPSLRYAPRVDDLTLPHQVKRVAGRTP